MSKQLCYTLLRALEAAESKDEATQPIAELEHQLSEMTTRSAIITEYIRRVRQRDAIAKAFRELEL